MYSVPLDPYDTSFGGARKPAYGFVAARERSRLSLSLLPSPSTALVPAPSSPMSDNVTINFSLFHAIVFALVLLTGGGEAFAVFHRNALGAGEADLDAVELVVIGAVEGNVMLDVEGAADASN